MLFSQHCSAVATVHIAQTEAVDRLMADALSDFRHEAAELVVDGVEAGATKVLPALQQDILARTVELRAEKVCLR